MIAEEGINSMIKRYFRVLAVMIFFMILFTEGYKTWEYGIKDSTIGLDLGNKSQQGDMETKAGQSGESRGKIIEEDKYFKKMYLGNFIYSYAIYNAAGEIVEEGKGKQPVIDYIDDSTIRRQISAGTNAFCTVYYDIVNDRLSETYMNPIAAGYERVAYLDNRGGEIFLIVKNIFDNEFYNEFSLDFSDMLFPVKKAEFWDEDTLYIKYCSGESQVEKERTLKIEEEIQEKEGTLEIEEGQEKDSEEIETSETEIEAEGLAMSGHEALIYEINWENIVTPDMEEYDMSSESVKVSIPQFPSFVGYPVEIDSVLVEDVRHHCKDVYEISTTYELEGKVTYLDEQYVSVLYQGSIYSDTGASDIAWGTTIDIKTGEILSIEDVAELPAVLEKLEQKQFEQVRGITFDYYKELSGEEINAKEKYENFSRGSYDENHCHDFYLKEGKIGILLGMHSAVGGYIILELDR